MSIPETVKIAGIDYDIEFEDNLTHDGLECYGLIDYQTSTISMSLSQSEQMKLLTLIHEALHGIVFHYNVPIPPEIEEEVVEALTSGLHQFLRDNFFSSSPLNEEHAGVTHLV